MTDSLNCLRCRHCQLLPYSDFTREIVPIHCNRINRNLPAYIETLCPMADARPMIENRRYTGGDKPRSSTEAERAWLTVHYSQAAWPTITRLLQRDKLTVISLAKRLGLQRGDNPERRLEAAVRAQNSKKSHGHGFNVAQADYIESCFASNFWPLKHFGREPHKSQSEAIKAEIIARVSELDAYDRVWKWESIRSHMKWISPSYKRETVKRNKRRRPYQRSWAERKKCNT